MNCKPLQIAALGLALVFGVRADPLVTYGSLTLDPFDEILIDGRMSIPTVTLGGDAAGTISDVNFIDGLFTFDYTLAKNVSDPTQDGKWVQSYDVYAQVLNDGDPNQVVGMLRIQTTAGTGDALVTFSDGAFDVTGSTLIFTDPQTTTEIHNLIDFTPQNSTGDISGAFLVKLPEPLELGWIGLGLGGICLASRRLRHLQ